MRNLDPLCHEKTWMKLETEVEPRGDKPLTRAGLLAGDALEVPALDHAVCRGCEQLLAAADKLCPAHACIVPPQHCLTVALGSVPHDGLIVTCNMQRP